MGTLEVRERMNHFKAYAQRFLTHDKRYRTIIEEFPGVKFHYNKATLNFGIETYNWVNIGSYCSFDKQFYRWLLDHDHAIFNELHELIDWAQRVRVLAFVDVPGKTKKTSYDANYIFSVLTLAGHPDDISLSISRHHKTSEIYLYWPEGLNIIVP